jgi:hypothetical protein
MKTYAHVWWSHWVLFRLKYVSEFVGKIKTQVLCLETLVSISCHLWDNVKKYGRARHAIYDSVIWHMCIDAK